MPKREDLFAEASGDVTPAIDTREDRVKRHGLDPHDTAYRDHRYDAIPMPDPPKPASAQYRKAQRRIELVIHQVRASHPELDFREAWRFAANQLGIDLDAIAVDAA
jgi:hypothetical protein